MSERFMHWQAIFERKLISTGIGNDPAHDLAHIKRVVSVATDLARIENADLGVVIPAAWLHDLVNLPKDDPRRSEASAMSAEAAVAYLREVDYDLGDLDSIAHAIEAHSFSAAVVPRTLEAKIVQDADRLDALGAIGIARCFTVGALLARPFYDPEDPFAHARELNDRVYTIDHFPMKLFRIVETLQTEAGRKEGRRRADWMKLYLAELEREIS